MYDYEGTSFVNRFLETAKTILEVWLPPLRFSETFVYMPVMAAKLNLDDTEFQAAEWFCCSVAFVRQNLLGPQDRDFGKFFMAPINIQDHEQRNIWMKICTIIPSISDDDSEAGFYFLAFDPEDGSLWYQHAASISEISSEVQELNRGLEFEEDVLLGYIESVVKGKREEIRWRFATERIMERGSLVPSKIQGFISFRCLIGKIALDFKFNCEKVRWEVNSTRQMLPFAHLIQPFHMGSQYLINLTAQLISVIQKKDKEIEDYKNQGGKVSRKHIATLPFDADEFRLTHLQTFTPTSLTDISKFGQVMEVDNAIKKRFREITLEGIRKEAEIDIASETSPPVSRSASDVTSTKSVEDEPPIPAVKKAKSRTEADAAVIPKEAKKSSSTGDTTAKNVKKKRGLF